MPFPVSGDLLTQIRAIPKEEISRQHRLLAESGGTRGSMTLLVYALAAVFVPPPVVALCCAVDFGAEWLGFRWMTGLDPARAPGRYLKTMLALVLSQGAFALALALVFHSGAPYAQAFATGVITLTMLQLASIRVIHQPYAAVGLATTLVIALGAVLWDWPSRSGPMGLVLSVVALGAASYFIYAVVRANHALHASIARERQAARRADQAKSRFLAQMSHELRTPLNAILGLGHAELMQAVAPASQERLRLVTEAARGLAVLLDDILDMAASEAGHLPIRPAPCQPASEISAAAALYRPLFEAQGLTVTLDLGPDLPDVAVLDAQRLRQCLTNLCSNALKHTAEGGLRLAARLGAPGLLEIHVSDTGPGIPEAEAERIFQPFQRGTSEQPGTGLGLSITRALARAMGGDLQLLCSETGAHFLLTLAFAAAPAGPEPVTMAPRSASAGARVLIVDDLATNRLVARAHLRLLGLVTEEAASGAEAVEKIRANPPDIVFLDMNMPGLDGLATLKLIRKLPSRAAKVAVVAMTADATEAHRVGYLAAGLDGYLAKPLTPEAVADVVQRFAGSL
jgi:signal transduction histidine kinase/ActR/RegA family two-component response regulator